MKGNTALITGGMGGIGTSIAQHLYNCGCRVAVTYNKAKDHEYALAWQEKQLQQGFEFLAIYCDVSDYDSCKSMAQEVTSKLGHVDILVNNAGITHDSTFKKMSLEQWHEVINTNLNSLFNINKNFINSMIERNYGRIINISSVNSRKGQFGQTNYCASKSGIDGFTRALAYEVAKKGITVNTVSPGYVDTQMVAKVNKGVMDQIISNIPVGRLAKPKEIAYVVEFLARKESEYITGADFAINGGYYMS